VAAQGGKAPHPALRATFSRWEKEKKKASKVHR
jgi:hypothetical protein